MKIAISLSGLPRYHTASLRSIETHLSQYAPDIYIHTYEVNNLSRIIKDSWNKASSAKYYKENHDIENIVKQFNPKKNIIDDYAAIRPKFFETFAKIIYTPKMQMYSMESSVGLISMFYSIKKSMELMTENYDKIIRMRFDSIIEKPIDIESMTKDAIYIPKGNNFGGLNDQFAIGPPELMKKYSQTYDAIEKICEAIKTYHPETILRNHLLETPIERFEGEITLQRK